jgi:iron complex transport system ATP-binding protein
MNSYVEITNFSCGYASGFALKELSFSIGKGVFAGIIGPNGSGKTTLFRGISGEIKGRRGAIRLNGVDLLAMPDRERARTLAVVSQFPELADVTLEEYVLMGRLPYRKPLQFFESDYDLAVADRYMKLTGIYPLRHQQISQLSGGEQQLAAIAQSLTQEPKLLLLDEPTSHLDISHQIEVLNLIQRLNEELGLTVLMIIHDLNLASEYCDYLIMMSNGDIFCQGTPHTVLTYQNIEQVYNAAVITQQNPVSGRPAVFLISNRMMGQRGSKMAY